MFLVETDNNKLNGKIPSEVGMLQSLTKLNLCEWEYGVVFFLCAISENAMQAMFCFVCRSSNVCLFCEKAVTIGILISIGILIWSVHTFLISMQLIINLLEQYQLRSRHCPCQISHMVCIDLMLFFFTHSCEVFSPSQAFFPNHDLLFLFSIRK